MAVATARPKIFFPPVLAEIARPAGVPVFHDLGAGALIDLSPYGLEREPTVREALAAARVYLAAATNAVVAHVEAAGGAAAFDVEQRRLHALAWTATTVEALAQLRGWSERAAAAGAFSVRP